MNYCVDCKHHRAVYATGGLDHLCLRDMVTNVDLVTGMKSESGHLKCKEERYGTSGCAQMAKYFEKRT